MPKPEMSPVEKELRAALADRMKSLNQMGYSLDSEFAQRMIGDHVIALIRCVMKSTTGEYQQLTADT